MITVRPSKQRLRKNRTNKNPGLNDTQQKGMDRCLNSDPHARIATNHCHPALSKHAFAAMNVHSARHVLMKFWRMSAPTAVVDLFPDLSARQRTGKTTTSLARIRRAPKSSTGRSTRQPIRRSRPRSSPYPRRSASTNSQVHRDARVVSSPVSVTRRTPI